MITKTCTKCGRVLPLDSFYRKQDAKSGFASRCKDCTRSRYFEDSGAGRASAMAPPRGVITLAEAANICREMTGFDVTAKYMRGQVDNFPHIARWRAGSNGGQKFVGIIKSRLVALIQGRIAVRGQCALLQDIFSLEDL